MERLPTSTPLLSPQDMATLRGLRFVARRRVEGRLAGLHTSRRRGRGSDFADRRGYLPGDPPGDVDWKVFARSDRLYVKRYEHAAQMTVHLLVDASASMGRSGGGAEGLRGLGAEVGNRETTGWRGLSRWLGRVKGYRLISTPQPLSPLAPRPLGFAKRIAAAIALLVTRNGDACGLGCASGASSAHVSRVIPPRRGPVHLRQVLRVLEDIEGSGEAGLARAIKHVMGRAGRRSALVVLSDLHEPRAGVAVAMSAWIARGGEVTVFHVLHPQELDPWAGHGEQAVMFIDSETGQRVRLDPAAARDAYQRRLREHLDAWREDLMRRGVSYTLARCDESPLAALRYHLIERSRRA